MTERRRLDLSEIDDWQGELSFIDGEVFGTPAPRTKPTGPTGPTGPTSRARGPDWARARDLLHRAFPGALVDTGHTRQAARSSSRAVFIAPVDVNGFLHNYVVCLPRDHEDAGYAARARREWRILVQLTREADLPFRTAQPVALLLDDGAPVIVESDVHGVPYDGSAMSMHDPCACVASIAAALHRLDVDAPGPATRREVALAAIAALDEAPASSAAAGPHEAIIRDAIAFARTMLPRAEPTRFVHEHLLEGNILQSLEPEDTRVAVVGFERAARGDPARDLATVTRGMKKPFGVDDGFERLLDEYARAGGAPIEASDVRVYEALLLAEIVRASHAGGAGASVTPPETQRLVALLKRS